MTSMATVYNDTWYEDIFRWNTKLFLVPAATLTGLTLLADPLLLACILYSHALRQEKRYLLLANMLAADVVFLAFNMAVMSCNVLRANLPCLACELLTGTSISAYCCSMLSITLMVVDTYVAIRWPLHYQRLLPHSRTQLILVGTWLLSAMYPVSQVIMMEVREGAVPWNHTPCLVLSLLGSVGGSRLVGVYMLFSVGVVLCTGLILYCYIQLYAITKTSGIWCSRYSRAPHIAGSRSHAAAPLWPRPGLLRGTGAVLQEPAGPAPPGADEHPQHQPPDSAAQSLRSLPVWPPVPRNQQHAPAAAPWAETKTGDCGLGPPTQLLSRGA